jgi:uncharacterized protein (DUF433 family)
MSGEPTVSGTRILATTILGYLQHGSSAEEIFRTIRVCRSTASMP